MTQAKERLLEIDIIKVFFLIEMLFCHAWCFFGDHTNPTLYGHIVDKLCWGCAAAFMFCMGMCFVFSKKQSIKAYFKRGLKILLYGFLLNIFRETVPYYLLMKGSNTTQLFPSAGSFNFTQTFDLPTSILSGDILVFAGLAILLITLFKWLKLSDIWIIIISAVLYVAGQLSYSAVQGTWVGTYIPCLFNINLDFLLPSWLPYVVLGYFFAKSLPEDESKRGRSYRHLALWGLLCAIVCLVLSCIFEAPYSNPDLVVIQFHCQPPIVLLLTLSMVFLSFALAYYCAKMIHSKKLISFFNHIGNLLNNIYIVHWLILGWSMAILYRCDVLVEQENDWIAAGVGILLVVLSYFTTILYKRLRKA